MDWRNIDGWFSEEDARCYEVIVENTPVNGMVAEIGCYLGRSTCCLISLIQAADKNINIHVVDTFKGSKEHQGLPELPTLRKQFEDNVKSTGYPWVYVHPYESSEYSSHIPNSYLHAVFIDGSHEPPDPSNDIQAWLPKIRKGGIIAGHDYDYPSVEEAVCRRFGSEPIIERIGRCWLVRLT